MGEHLKITVIKLYLKKKFLQERRLLTSEEIIQTSRRFDLSFLPNLREHHKLTAVPNHSAIIITTRAGS